VQEKFSGPEVVVVVSHAGFRHGRGEVHADSGVVTDHFDHLVQVSHAIELRRFCNQHKTASNTIQYNTIQYSFNKKLAERNLKYIVSDT